jgi:hypothetical protein
MDHPGVGFVPCRAGDVLSLLEVVTPGRRSMLEPIRSVLFRLRVQIVRVESVVHDTHLIERFQLVEFDGGPIERRRAATIRAEVRKVTLPIRPS